MGTGSSCASEIYDGKRACTMTTKNMGRSRGRADRTDISRREMACHAPLPKLKHVRAWAQFHLILIKEIGVHMR